jgi:hypothetical protein
LASFRKTARLEFANGNIGVFMLEKVIKIRHGHRR